MLWRERNDRVFRGKSTLAAQLSAKIVDEVAVWSLAGFPTVVISHDFASMPGTW
jgi:hypothetical protein